ncbi:hypothetical protein C8F04DRAFT_1128813 [Mycena alexandri]|uniref:Uncharacterized protein n=1 Tax=Mycena alexandri TaxID=1745969 RepID=A0AAD6SCL0_9AGAR|nr:hypothetical protein C8F04DRAFT_1128813 [Mycena alexandri]
MDQLFTLPVFNRNHHGTNSIGNAKNPFKLRGLSFGLRLGAGDAATQRHGKTDSVVSVRTENEINELIELMSPTSPSSSAFAVGRRTERAQKTQMTDQMILDAMYHSVVGKGNHGNGMASSEDVSDDEEGYDNAEETDGDADAFEQEYFPTSSVSYESESEADLDLESVPASPPNEVHDAHYQYLHPTNANGSGSSGGRHPNAVGGGAYIPFHLPRRTSNVNITPIDTTARSRGSTPSLMSSSSKSSVSSRTSMSVSTPPLSPDGSGSASGGQALLPSIEERFARDGSGGGLAYDDDDDDEEDDEEYGYARYARDTPAVHLRDGAPWPTQKSRVEWIARNQHQQTEEDTGITPMKRTVSPTPSDAETVSPRPSGTFVARILARKLGPGSPTSPMSPRSPLSPKSELFMDTKAKKAEEKRRKKERVEELARALKEKEKKAKADPDRISDRMKEKRMHMMEPVPMYGGFGMKM